MIDTQTKVAALVLGMATALVAIIGISHLALAFMNLRAGQSTLAAMSLIVVVVTGIGVYALWRALAFLKAQYK